MIPDNNDKTCINCKTMYINTTTTEHLDFQELLKIDIHYSLQYKSMYRKYLDAHPWFTPFSFFAQTLPIACNKIIILRLEFWRTFKATSSLVSPLILPVRLFFAFTSRALIPFSAAFSKLEL